MPSDNLRLATLRVLHQQLLEAKRTAAIVESDYRPGLLAADTMRMLAGFLGSSSDLVAMLIEAEPRLAAVDRDREPSDSERFLQHMADAMDRAHEATS